MLETGIIGVGLLGSAIARRWLQAGYEVLAFDRDPHSMKAVQAAGAECAPSSDEIWARCPRVALVLPDSAASRTVLNGAQPRDGAIVMDMTTGDPDDMAQLGSECSARGFTYLDTTVAGSSSQVLAGDSIVMIGGDPAAVEKCRQLLASFAWTVFHLGGAGSGARMKLAVNLALGLHRAVLAETLGFAEACGLDPAKALEILRAGPAYSKAMDTKGDKMLNGDFTPQARLAQHRKDVDLILRQAELHSARVPFSLAHRQLLLELEEAGFGADDNSAIIRAFRKSCR